MFWWTVLENFDSVLFGFVFWLLFYFCLLTWRFWTEVNALFLSFVWFSIFFVLFGFSSITNFALLFDLCVCVVVVDLVEPKCLISMFRSLLLDFCKANVAIIQSISQNPPNPLHSSTQASKRMSLILESVSHIQSNPHF